MSQTEPVPLADAASSRPGGGGPGGSGSELRRRIWFTIGALVVCRLGAHIPIPGIDPVFLVEVFRQQAAGILSVFDTVVGGALGRMTVFALGLVPYISAAVLMQVLLAVSRRVKALEREGEAGRRTINQYARYGTVVLCLLQAYGIAVGLESAGRGLVPDPGLAFRVSTALTLTAGTVFLMWLGEQITQRGVGNGMALIIFTGIVANLPAAIVSTLDLVRTGAFSITFIAFLLIMVVAVVAVVVFVERAQRRVVVQYPKRQVGAKMFGGKASHLPLKLNTSGVVPPLVASSLLLMPLTVTGFSGGGGPASLTWVSMAFAPGWPAYLTAYAVLIVVFTFFYAKIVFNPADIAKNLEWQGGFIPGVRPGRDTAAYLNQLMNRLTTLGAAYLALVCLLPEILISEFAVPFYFGGASLLIAVSVTMDTVGQIHSHLLAQRPGRRG